MNFSLKRITQEYSDIKRNLDSNLDSNLDPGPDKIINMQDLWGLNANCSQGIFDIVLERENVSSPALLQSQILYYLKVHYTKPKSAAFLFFREDGLHGLPDEINRLISEFLEPNYVTLRLKMEHNEGYPFNGILWSLVDFEERMNVLNLRKYYEDMIAEYNCESTTGWSPAIRLDRNILMMMCKINNFDELL